MQMTTDVQNHIKRVSNFANTDMLDEKPKH